MNIYIRPISPIWVRNSGDATYYKERRTFMMNYKLNVYLVLIFLSTACYFTLILPPFRKYNFFDTPLMRMYRLWLLKSSDSIHPLRINILLIRYVFTVGKAKYTWKMLSHGTSALQHRKFIINIFLVYHNSLNGLAITPWSMQILYFQKLILKTS